MCRWETVQEICKHFFFPFVGASSFLNYHFYSYYYASVVIGNPSVSFDLILDTGSSDLVVLAAPCYYGCDNSTQLYQPQNSATSKVSTIPFAIEYGIGEATGVLINDEVKLGGFSVNQVCLLVIADKFSC